MVTQTRMYHFPRTCAAHSLAALCITATLGRAGPPLYDKWDNFGMKDGLPSERVFCVHPTTDTVWAGTDRGLARYRDKRWEVFSKADGLPHTAVLAIAEDSATGDLWLATMGGLARYSAGRFDTFSQFDSGLANDVVYGITVQDGVVWAATAAGASRYDSHTHTWTIFDETNTPMHEIWCYSVTRCRKRIYLGVWGGGVLEFDPLRGRWRDYRDPDGEMEIDLFRDDGLVHDVISSVSCDQQHRIWVGTYFGLSSYDGRRWRNFLDHDTPLTSNFINAVRGRGDYAWIATDDGLCATDREEWWVYRRSSGSRTGSITHFDSRGIARVFQTEAIFRHNYILGIGFQGDDIWLATAQGVAHGAASGRTQISEAGRATQPSAYEVERKRGE